MKENNNLVSKGQVADITAGLHSPDLLTKEQIESLLPNLDSIISWAKQVQEYALEQALKGTRYEGYKVVAGKSNRKFTNPDLVVDTLLGEGYDESMIYERSLKSLTSLEALVGKKNFEPLLGSLIEKPLGKPALVTADDKRPEFIPEDAAAADFK